MEVGNKNYAPVLLGEAYNMQPASSEVNRGEVNETVCRLYRGLSDLHEAMVRDENIKPEVGEDWSIDTSVDDILTVSRSSFSRPKGIEIMVDGLSSGRFVTVSKSILEYKEVDLNESVTPSNTEVTFVLQVCDTNNSNTVEELVEVGASIRETVEIDPWDEQSDTCMEGNIHDFRRMMATYQEIIAATQADLSE